MKYKSKMKSGFNRGFTLIEIMVVVVIIAIMASVAAPLVISRIHESRVVAASQQMAIFSGALDLYKLDNFVFPTEDEGLDALVNKTESAKSRWKPYVKEIPKDPWGSDYVYSLDGDEFDIVSYGADGAEGGADEAKDISLYDETEEE